MTGLLLKTIAVSAISPYPAAIILAEIMPKSPKGTRNRSLLVMSSMSLLLLSAALATLSTINFSLGLLVGLLAAPLSFIHHIPSHPGRAQVLGLAMNLVSPPVVLLLGPALWLQFGGDSGARSSWVGASEALQYASSLLVRASEAWAVEGTWTAVVIWLVWWPAWFVGAVALNCSKLMRDEGEDGA